MSSEKTIVILFEFGGNVQPLCKPANEVQISLPGELGTNEMLMPDLRERLLANWTVGGDVDHVPVMKLFFPLGAQTWLITEMNPAEPDILFGLCDLGCGFPELGYVSLAELKDVRNSIGIGVQRDLLFAPRYPLSVYTEAARMAGCVVTDDDELLKQAAAKLGKDL